MKVVYIAETIGGGVRKHLDLLLENLNNKYELVVIHGPRVDDIFKENIKKYQEQGIKVYCLSTFQRKINLKQDILTYHSVSNILKKEKPDIVHCHSSKAGIIGRLAAKIHRVPKIFYTPHGYAFQANEFPKNKRKLFSYIERVASKFLTTMTFNVSNGERKEALIRNIDNVDKFTVIYNGLPNIILKKINLRDFLHIPTDSIIIGNCARVASQKNPDYFVDIALKVISENKKYHFVWIGDGPSEVIKKYNDLSENIHFIGFNKDADSLIKDFNVFLSTSYYEGMPYSLIESLRAGVPIIATDVVGNNEIVVENQTGFLLNNDSDIIDLIRNAMKLNAADIKVQFQQNFSLENMLGKIESYYDS